MQPISSPLKPGAGSGFSASFILAISILAAFTIFITRRARQLEVSLGQPQVHVRAPDFWAATPDGRTVSLADFHGKKKLLVTFWASWCGPCHLELAALNQFYKHYHSVSSDFEILAISVDLDPASATRYATEESLSFPVLLDPTERVERDYETSGLPTMFLIDRNGEIVYSQAGFNNLNIVGPKSIESLMARELNIDLKEVGKGDASDNASH